MFLHKICNLWVFLMTNTKKPGMIIPVGLMNIKRKEIFRDEEF